MMSERQYNQLETAVKWAVIVGIWAVIVAVLLGVYALADLVF